MEGHISLQRSFDAGPLQVPKGIACVEDGSCKVRLRLRDDLEEPLDHITPPFSIDGELVRPCRDANRRLNFG